MKKAIYYRVEKKIEEIRHSSLAVLKGKVIDISYVKIAFMTENLGPGFIYQAFF